MDRILKTLFSYRRRHSSPRQSVFFAVFLAVFLLLVACATLDRVPNPTSQPEHQGQNEIMLCPPTHTPTPTHTLTPTLVPSPEFGSFEPSSWVTRHNPICSIETRDRVSGLDTTSARYRWSSSGLEDLQHQPWLSAAMPGGDGTTEWQTISVTIPFTRDSSSHNFVQFAITNTAGYSATSTSHTVAIDTIPPGPWWDFTRIPDLGIEVTAGQSVTYTIVVSDALSGLDCGEASYRHWTDSGWSEWLPATCTEISGTTTPHVIGTRSITYVPYSTSLSCTNKNKVEFRIADIAGHFSSVLRQEEYCSYLPIVMYCYPLVCCDVPLNRDFTTSESGFAAHWKRGYFSPLTVTHYSNQKIFMGYKINTRFDLPNPGGCAYARLYQDFYLPNGCFDDLWLQFDYQLRSYDYDRPKEGRPGGDTFSVYVKDLISGTNYPLYSDRSHQTRKNSKDGLLYDSGWTKPPSPLKLPLGGGPVRLWFEVRHCEGSGYSEAWWPTWVYLDDVVITNEP